MADVDSRGGKPYATPELLGYVASVHAPHDASLQQAFEAPSIHGLPTIMVAPSEGKLLQLLLRLIRARKVVEVGTLAGYSALWMVHALPPAGRLFTLESSREHARVARENFVRAGVDDRVSIVVGDAAEELENLEAEGPFDAIFIDADKGQYPAYGAWAARNVRPGGLLVADNVFYFGRLLEESREARAMRAFHEAAARAFDTVCVTTPDGLLVGIRRGT